MKNLIKYLVQGIITLRALVLTLSILMVGMILFVGYSINFKSFKRGYEEAKGMVTHLIEQIL